MDNLTKISLALSFLGILTLLFISTQIPTKLLDIEDISEDHLNKKIAIEGTMISINNYNNFQTMRIKDDTGIIKVISNSYNPLNKTSDTLLIIGTVIEYQDDLEISADQIRKLED
jgi:RecJ-like exonuclease